MMTPRTGRPPIENPRNKMIAVRVTEEEYQALKEARSKSKKPENSLSTWVSLKVAEMAKRLAGKK